ncbi:hypothetical protein [Novosphingobium aerophilum]|uniref:Uncharacterized protein n=1 Tax=Novosphingobium aerophilum TaxID=2839843 RepID=A0A7X1F6Z1_9SPHN|nr:hypothetical protein [Novosphingobium aerophilum]MBC2651550.1 hypothetical protein [Novosphingobium aerophilum]
MKEDLDFGLTFAFAHMPIFLRLHIRKGSVASLEHRCVLAPAVLAARNCSQADHIQLSKAIIADMVLLY